MTHNPPVEVVLSDGKTVLVAESMLLPSKQGYRVLTAKDFRQGLVNDPIQMARLVPPMITKGKKERTTEKKSAYNFVQNELEKSEIRGVLEYALALLISKGEEGITLRSLSSEHFGADKAGTDPDRTVRALRAFGAVINTERDGDNTRYILEAPPTPKSTEQRTREALVSMLVKALKRAGRVEENGSLTESESTTRDTKFGRMIREVSDNVDFLGGKDANVHSAMHIYGHAKGGPDLRSNGVLGDHNTNHQDEVGALNFYVRDNQKVVVISEGYRKGEYILTTLFDPDEELSQKKWIILSNMEKGVTQIIPEWFWAWVKQVAPEDFKTLWDNYKVENKKEV